MVPLRTLALMAHPDDAEILCAGTLLRLAEAGCEVHIATLASGDWGTATETVEAIGVRRRGEAQTSAAMMGATYHCLRECDGLIVYDKATLQKCYDLCREVGPQLVFTHTPLDYMMDHVVVSQLARAASFVYGAQRLALPLREGSRVPYLYYCDAIEGIDPLGAPVQPTAYVDISGQLKKKAEMLACHASQRDWLRAHHGTDEYVDAMRRHAAVRGKEVGVAAAEAFVQHRGHAYPKDNLLAEFT